MPARLSSEKWLRLQLIDLTADQTGARIAKLAIIPQNARQLQQIAAELRDERRFFPNLNSVNRP